MQKNNAMHIYLQKKSTLQAFKKMIIAWLMLIKICTPYQGFTINHAMQKQRILQAVLHIKHHNLVQNNFIPELSTKFFLQILQSIPIKNMLPHASFEQLSLPEKTLCPTVCNKNKITKNTCHNDEDEKHAEEEVEHEHEDDDDEEEESENKDWLKYRADAKNQTKKRRMKKKRKK
jgi:hypothetical protein